MAVGALLPPLGAAVGGAGICTAVASRQMPGDVSPTGGALFALNICKFEYAAVLPGGFLCRILTVAGANGDIGGCVHVGGFAVAQLRPWWYACEPLDGGLADGVAAIRQPGGEAVGSK